MDNNKIKKTNIEEIDIKILDKSCDLFQVMESHLKF